MALQLITPPPVEPVSADEVAEFIRVDFDDDAATIETLIASAREPQAGSDKARVRGKETGLYGLPRGSVSSYPGSPVVDGK
jgi:hypothetical protein